jgi:hypothetical protein
LIGATHDRCYALNRCYVLFPMLRWLAAALSLSLVFSCADKQPSAPLDEPDSGRVCNRGSVNCVCTSSGRCDDGLLCIAGRCLASGTEPDPPEPPIRRPNQPRPPSVSDGGGEVADADAEPSDVSAPPLDATPASDSGEELDASAD